MRSCLPHKHYAIIRCGIYFLLHHDAIQVLEPCGMQVMVIGGCSSDKCGTGTPATAFTWRIDLDDRPKEWVRELMPIRRVMGASTLLPDGTVFVGNGAGVGECSFVLLPGMQALEIDPILIRVETALWVIVSRRGRDSGIKQSGYCRLRKLACSGLL